MLNEEMDEGGEKQSHVYVWQCSREKVYGLIFFKKKKKDLCQLNNEEQDGFGQTEMSVGGLREERSDQSLE